MELLTLIAQNSVIPIFLNYIQIYMKMGAKSLITFSRADFM